MFDIVYNNSGIQKITIITETAVETKLLILLIITEYRQATILIIVVIIYFVL